jgi:uncharacterized protein YceH (UPF0502 family)
MLKMMGLHPIPLCPSAAYAPRLCRYTPGMLELQPHEARVLGVLIEKELTTPEQYPQTLNALVNGCNQKNNRDPIVTLSEDDVHDAVEALRSKGAVVRVDMAGSRVPKYKHVLAERLKTGPRENALLAELLLRGPQTLGELRTRASRMQNFETLEVVRLTLEGLAGRDEPLCQQIAPAPGSRADRYTQLLARDVRAASAGSVAGHDTVMERSSSASLASAVPPDSALADRVSALEAEVAALRDRLNALATALGETASPAA